MDAARRARRHALSGSRARYLAWQLTGETPARLGTMGSKWPALKRTVPTYPPLYVSIARVVPTFFIMGACIELFMQKVPIGGRTRRCAPPRSSDRAQARKCLRAQRMLLHMLSRG